MSGAGAILTHMDVLSLLYLALGLLVGATAGVVIGLARGKATSTATLDPHNWQADLAAANQATLGKQEIITKLEAQLENYQLIEKEQNELIAKFTPLEKQMKDLQEQVRVKDEAQNDAFTAIKTQIESSQSAERELRNQTAALANALAKPGGKGSWGELTLERLLESFGMLETVDWLKKEKLAAEDEKDDQKRRFPDVVIRLPHDRYIAVDSKVPYTNYLAAMDEEDEVKDGDFSKRDALLIKYVSDIKTQVVKLAERNYYNGLTSSPEFTVLYMPNEPALSVALRVDPQLLEYAFKLKIVLTTPSSFYTTIKTVAHIWSRSEDQKAVDAVMKVAQTFMQQSRLLAGEVAALKKGIQGAADAYNAMAKRMNKAFLKPTIELASAASLAQSAGEISEATAIDTQMDDLNAIEYKNSEPKELE